VYLVLDYEIVDVTRFRQNELLALVIEDQSNTFIIKALYDGRFGLPSLRSFIINGFLKR